jgi:hypothetical protein
MRVGAVALLVLLAGCPGLAGQSTPTADVTPAPVPETETYPPGVGPAGVVDPTALARVHSAAVDATSYTLVSNRTITAGNGSLRSHLALTVRLARDRSYHARARTAGPAGPVFLGAPPARAEFWSNGTVYVRAVERESGWTYNEFTPPNEFVASWRYWRSTAAFGGEEGFDVETLATLFGSIPTALAGTRTENGTTLYRLTGDRALRPDFAKTGTGPVRNVSLDATVTEAGVVRAFDLSYERRQCSVPVRVVWTLRYDAVGRTTADRPAWFARAVGQASSTNSTVTAS